MNFKARANKIIPAIIALHIWQLIKLLRLYLTNR